ncbi:hypothetical protein C8Q76DRAFT_438867 [Earliella scabrosa]|nr:hypothetical protein C8Q76DRAFT_438867 [Earliella scabrosa]
MPKEPKSAFCCGELQVSPQQHRREVHQRWSRIRFEDHPEASFTLRRDDGDHLFHCPKCEQSSALAGPLRSHILHQCPGYAEYRPACPKIKIKPMSYAEKSEGESKDEAPEADNATRRVKQEEDTVGEPSASADADIEELSREVMSGLQSKYSLQSLLYPESSCGQPELDGTPEPTSPKPSDDADLPPSTDSDFLPPPILRPASWTPLNSNTIAQMLPPLAIGSTSTPSLVRTESIQSTSISLYTVSDRPSCSPSVPVKIEPDYSFDSASRSALPLRLPPRVDHALNRNTGYSATATAARLFLEGLRRPLGHATPHLHALGIVTDADLDLVCTMPGTWEELGEILRVNGVSMIEWLMVKEAFKTRATRVSGVA